MFKQPTKTLEQSLLHVLENAEEYVGDICFEYPTIKIWAHKAVLLVRVPSEFREKHMKNLLNCNRFDMTSVIPSSCLEHLLRFWYTADMTTEGGKEIEQWKQKLQLELLPKAGQEQWISDLKRMKDEKLCTDVVLNIFQVNNPQPSQEFPAHRFILAGQSKYFYSVFCTEFREATTSSVHLPSDLFTSDSLDVILRYLYTDHLVLPAFKTNRLNEKRHHLRILQKVYAAADYLGHAQTMGQAVLCKMQHICHQFKCVCQECAALLPFVLFFSDRQSLTALKEHLIQLYADPESFSLWSQKPFAVLAQHDCTQNIGQRALGNVTQQNAVRVLHSIHHCLSRLRSADPVPTWSQAILQMLAPLLHHTTDWISNQFDYYCVEYPVLLSCVDGIGEGFSVDFLEFVLTRVLTEGIHDGNAPTIYQGIVRDLGGRQEMVKNVAVDGVLSTSRLKCAQYISKHWMMIKAENGFQSMEKEVLKELAEDINVPCKSLLKPLESDFSTLFSFKPKKTCVKPDTKRFSVHEVEENKPRETRARSLSATTSILKKPTDIEDRPFQKRHQGSHASLTEALLPIDTNEPVTMDTPARKSRLKFALPDTPTRPHRTMVQRTKPPKNKSRWSLGYTTSDSSEDEGPASMVPEVGQKVELLRRPLPTLGTIKYIGTVEFSKGTLVGIELESRVGNNDGSVNGKRYFQTFPQRGVFVKLDDFKIITIEKK